METINKRKLSEEFNLEPIDIPIDVENVTPKPVSVRDPIQILYNNIDRANKLLDILDRQVDDGIESRQIEVAAKMIETINSAVEKIFTNQIEYDMLSLKDKMLGLKQRELDIKEKMGLLSGAQKVNQQNILITDRESILKVIREKKENILKEGEVKENDNESGELSSDNSGTT
jgi:hypothetical protein